jgi:diguanylate cyclase (GGDEF)-like protein
MIEDTDKLAKLSQATDDLLGNWKHVPEIIRLDPSPNGPIPSLISQLRDTAKELLTQSAYDSLTGLYNRRGFDSATATKEAEANRIGTPLTAVIIDLTKFKEINDQYGHAGGDAVLRHFAEVVKQTVRGGDIVGRTGGDEFALLLDSDTLGAQYAVNKIKIALATHPLVFQEHKINIEASFGLHHVDTKFSVHGAFAAADEGMYQDKAKAHENRLSPIVRPIPPSLRDRLIRSLGGRPPSR